MVYPSVSADYGTRNVIVHGVVFKWFVNGVIVSRTVGTHVVRAKSRHHTYALRPTLAISKSHTAII